MKKNISLIMILSCLFILTGCSVNSSEAAIDLNTLTLPEIILNTEASVDYSEAVLPVSGEKMQGTLVINSESTVQESASESNIAQTEDIPTESAVEQDRSTLPATIESVAETVPSTESVPTVAIPETAPYVSNGKETESENVPRSVTKSEQQNYAEPAAQASSPVQTTKPANEVVSQTEEVSEVKLFHVVKATAFVNKEARSRGLSQKLEEANTLPIFKVNSLEEAALLCEIFKDDYISGDDTSTCLSRGIASYNKDFFLENVLYVVYLKTGSSSYEEEHFRLETLIQEQVLHLRIGVAYPPGQATSADESGYWIFVPVKRADADAFIAYDASIVGLDLPPNWTEVVNPDWRQ